jgi:hypothetical protein
MNHKKATLSIAAIVVAVVLTAAALAIPQQALAYKHHHHHHHHHHNNDHSKSNSIDVTQNTGQANVCSNALCLNNGNNTANIG